MNQALQQLLLKVLFVIRHVKVLRSEAVLVTDTNEVVSFCLPHLQFFLLFEEFLQHAFEMSDVFL